VAAVVLVVLVEADQVQEQVVQVELVWKQQFQVVQSVMLAVVVAQVQVREVRWVPYKVVEVQECHLQVDLQREE
tara:strand:- start:83 stop:304 length:222 start_codon:yes stop_codon:yes gene_type:complete